MYSPVVQDHFHHPRNVGPLTDATHRGTGGIPGEGPYVQLWLRVQDGRVEAAAWKSYGCPAAVACASLAAEWAIGKTLDEAAALTEAELVRLLEGLPEGKEHCPRLAVAALRQCVGARVQG